MFTKTTLVIPTYDLPTYYQFLSFDLIQVSIILVYKCVWDFKPTFRNIFKN